MARDGNVEDKDGVSVLINGDIAALVASNGGDFDRRRDDPVNDVVDYIFTTWSVLLFGHLF